MQPDSFILDESLTHISKRKLTSLNLFWLGYIIYTFAYSLCATLVYISIAQLQALQINGILLFLPSSFNMLKFSIKNQYLKTLFIIYLLWLTGVVVRGIALDFASIKALMFEQGYGIFIYFTPLALLIPQNFTYYKRIFDVVFIFAGIFLLLDVIFIKDIFNPDRQSVLSQGIVENFFTLSYPCGFMLLTYIYHTPKKRIFALGIMMLTLLMAIYRARRALIFECITTLLFVLMIYLIISKKTAMVIYLAIIIALLGALYYSSLYNQSNFGIFNFLVERGDDDTRTGVEVFYRLDMTDTDWMMGKGINGGYYCPNIDMLDLTGNRTVIETGYLQIILKGGIISLVLLLLILFPAAILGLFYSKNILGKASGMWILLWMFYLYPTVANSFTMHYILIWMAVGICYNKKLRTMDEDLMLAYFNKVGEKKIPWY